MAAVKAPALLPGVAITPASALAASGPAAEKSFANIASRLLPPGHGGQVGQVHKLLMVDEVGQVVDIMGKVDKGEEIIEIGVDHHK